MKLLVLTDFSTHSGANSLYSIVNALYAHDVYDEIHIASRGLAENKSFFYDLDMSKLTAVKVDGLISYPYNESEGPYGEQKLSDYDYILLRLPRPIPDGFFDALEGAFDKKYIMNRPSGITLTGNKNYLLNFPDYTPKTALCKNFHDIETFAKANDVVLKPLENYGGKGIVRIMGDKVDYEGEKISIESFKKIYNESPVTYLAMEYLVNVDQGDKRIVVVNGEVMATSLRLPAPDSWLCNVAQGGSARLDTPTAVEKEIVDYISPILLNEGIVMYGLDTLMGNEGVRVISEINTLSSGGIHETIKDSDGTEAKRFAGLFKKHIKELSK